MCKRKREIMYQLLTVQNDKCYYCRRDIALQRKARAHDKATFDHIVLASEGGEISFQNGVAACHPCNSLRADKHWMKWMRFIRKVGYQELMTEFVVREQENAKIVKESRKAITAKRKEATQIEHEIVQLRQTINKSKGNPLGTYVSKTYIKLEHCA